MQGVRAVGPAEVVAASRSRHTRRFSSSARTFRVPSARSALGGIADQNKVGRLRPLMTLSGHLVASFDHLVGAGEQRGWLTEAEHFRGLEIDDQLEFSRLLDW